MAIICSWVWVGVGGLLEVNLNECILGAQAGLKAVGDEE